jgi:predicted glutamine amidotransferase
MCRLLGVTNFDLARHETLVARFCGLASTGAVMPGDPPGHRDGWGIALYREGNLEVHKSGGNLLDETDELMGILQGAPKSPVLILHLRKSAWKDSSSARHAHPFQHGNVAFVHNGVVYGYERLLPTITIPGPPPDALDTEVFFYHVVTGAQTHDLREAFRDTVGLIKREYRYSALNTLFSDGGRLFAYRDFSKEPDYYSLLTARDRDSVYVSSEPLDETFAWTLMEKEEFLEIPV